MVCVRVLSALTLLLVGCNGSSPVDRSSPNPTSPSPISPPSPTLIRIMPLGDSITQGNQEHDSYRRLLWLRLRSAGYPVDFIGSQRRNHGGAPPHDDFDWDHEGHWGWRADEILEHIGTWASRYPPDIVLIHLGTNDVLQQQDAAETGGELGQIIDELRHVNPRVTLLLARLNPLTHRAGNAGVRALNEHIDRLGRDTNREDSPVVVVGHDTDFDPTTDTYDGIHLNQSGEEKMADRWYAILDGLLSNRP